MTKHAIALALLAVLMSFLATGTAAAHSKLDSSVPVADSVVESVPEQIALTFNQQIESAFANIAVTDAGGKNWAVGKAAAEGMIVRVPVDPALPPDTYTVAYRVVSADGHPITGSYRFTYTARDGATTAPTTSRADTTEQTAPEPPQSDKSDTAVRWILIAALAGFALGGVFVVVRGSLRGKR